MNGLAYYTALCFLLISPTAHAATGLFFNIVETGPAPQLIEFTLCLNAKGPLTCQNYSTQHLNLAITTTIPNHSYPVAGIKVKTPGFTPTGCTMISNGYCIFTGSSTVTANITLVAKSNNPPWYPSLEAFEHYNSGRSHVFPQAFFGGSLNGLNAVNTLYSPISYPSGYNMSYLNSNLAYIYGGGYGDVAGSIGAYVDRVDPTTLQRIWHNQLIDVRGTGEWDYPGSLGILQDGYLYVSYGYRLAKLDPSTGQVIATLVLPTGGGLPENTSFNGFNATADGYIIMKSVYRQAGCLLQGPSALLNCPDPTDVPPSILISVNPKTMQVIDNVTLSLPVGARPTVTKYNNQHYVYLLGSTPSSACVPLRYIVQNGTLLLDSSWNPTPMTQTGQTLCTSFVVVNDWVVAQTNTLPSGTALSVISINQGNAAQQYSIQPFVNVSLANYIQIAFANAAPGGTQAISWAPMSVSGDSNTNLIYASDALAGEIAAIKISATGLTTVWTANQRTTEFTTLINPASNRVLVGTDIPEFEIPGNNAYDNVVWRDAATGAQLATTSRALPAITQGTMIQPYYFGAMFYPGQSGTLIKLSPSPN